MTMILNLLLVLLLQAPAPAPARANTVVVGLEGGQQLVIENPAFTGFIESRDGDAVLLYRQENFHGELSVKAISRIEFGEYRKGKPFAMTVTLRNGNKLEVESERRDFVMVKGKADIGTVTIKHPDPMSSTVKITTRRPNRKNDLTIQYLEFPAS